VAERLRALDRPLLPQRRYIPHRQEASADLSVAEPSQSASACSRRAGSSMTCSAVCSIESVRARDRAPRTDHARGLGRQPSLQRTCAYVQIGAMLGTMMVGNVFFVIIPAHRDSCGRSRRDASRPGGERPREAAIGPQQLPDAARRVHDALEPFRSPTAQLLVADLVVLLVIGAWVRHSSTCATSGERLGDSGNGSHRDRPARDPDPPQNEPAAGARRSGSLSRAHRRPRVPLAIPAATKAHGPRGSSSTRRRRSRRRPSGSSSRPCRPRRCRWGT